MQSNENNIKDPNIDIFGINFSRTVKHVGLQLLVVMNGRPVSIEKPDFEQWVIMSGRIDRVNGVVTSNIEDYWQQTTNEAFLHDLYYYLLGTPHLQALSNNLPQMLDAMKKARDEAYVGVDNWKPTPTRSGQIVVIILCLIALLAACIKYFSQQ